MVRLRRSLPFAALCMVLLLSSCSRPPLTDTRSLGEFDPRGLGKRVLIIAPNPDDECLAAGGLIQQALSSGAAVKVVIITGGDGAVGAARRAFHSAAPSPEQYRSMGRRRIGDSLNALEKLGVPGGDVILLCYPDGGTNSLWDRHWDRGSLHRGLNDSTRAPYAYSFRRRAPYCGASLESDLERVINEFHPSTVVYPDALDRHHDHWSTSAFTQYALVGTGYSGAELTYLVHRNGWPSPVGYAPRGYLLPPLSLYGLGTAWRYDPITRRQEALKGEAIDCYSLTMDPAGSFLRSFIRRNELFGIPTVGSAPVTGKPPSIRDSGAMPYVIERDPVGDEWTGGPAADLRDLSLACCDDGAYVGLRADGDIDPAYEYNIHFRFFAEHDVKRMDLAVRAGKVTCMGWARNSIAPVGATMVAEGPERFWVRLPSSMFDGVHTIMVSADCMVGDRRADMTAWQRFRLQAP